MRHPLLINSRISIGNPSFINIGGYAARVDNTLKNIGIL